ncbi:MAG: hypothetical protein K2N20_01900, partial [Helicobacter sp.]|nr:hypothetical protein [Helicobacter sp.]
MKLRYQDLSLKLKILFFISGTIISFAVLIGILYLSSMHLTEQLKAETYGSLEVAVKAKLSSPPIPLQTPLAICLSMCKA